MMGDNNPNFEGKSVTPESIEKMRISQRRRVESPDYINPMYGITPSPLCNKHYGSWYNTPLQGYKWLRSTWELAFAEYLDQHNVLWYYEAKRFYLSDEMSYEPDFFLPEQNKFIEIKGRNNYESWEKDDESRIKFEKFKQTYYHNVEILFRDELLSLGINLKYYIKKKSKKSIDKDEISYEKCLEELCKL